MSKTANINLLPELFIEIHDGYVRFYLGSNYSGSDPNKPIGGTYKTSEELVNLNKNRFKGLYSNCIITDRREGICPV